jgi:hypothetical protein
VALRNSTDVVSDHRHRLGSVSASHDDGNYLGSASASHDDGNYYLGGRNQVRGIVYYHDLLLRL